MERNYFDETIIFGSDTENTNQKPNFLATEKGQEFDDIIDPQSPRTSILMSGINKCKMKISPLDD